MYRPSEPDGLADQHDVDAPRFTNAVLTKIGYTKLVASAPAHAGTVRSLVFDPLSAKELVNCRTRAAGCSTG